MTGLWEVGLAVAFAIAGGYALWRFVAAVRFRLSARSPAAPTAQAGTADHLIKRAETAVSRLREQTEAPSDPILRAQIGDVDDHAVDVLDDLRRHAAQVKALERSLQEIPVERLRHDLAEVEHERAGSADDALRAELDSSMHAIKEQLAVADRLDTTRRTLLARIESAVFNLEGLGVRVTELIVMHDSAAATDTEANLADLTSDLDGLRAGLAEAQGLSDAILGVTRPADSPAAAPAATPRKRKRQPAPVAETPPPKPAAEPGRARWDLVTLAVVVVVALTCLADNYLPHRGTASGVGSGFGSTEQCPPAVAFLGELTGDDAGDGPAELDAVELAVTQDNLAHPKGCQILLQKYDSALAGDLAESAATITGDTSNIAVIGPTYGTEATAALPVFQAGGLAVISPSASDSALTTKGWTVFHRTLPSDDDQADAAARYLRDTLKARQVFVVGDDTDFSADVTARVRKTLGGTVAGHGEATRATTDWLPMVNRIKRSGADAVYFGGWSNDGASFVQALRAMMPKIPVLAGDKVITESFRKAAGNAGHGIYATCPCLPISLGLDQFRSQFTARYGSTPGYYAPEAYDAARIVLAGVRAGVTTRPAMLRFIDSWNEDGLGRHISFAPGGGLTAEHLNVWAYQSGSDGYFAPTSAIS